MSGPSQATSLSLPGRHTHDLLLQVGSPGPHPGPGSHLDRECLGNFLARAQLALKCQRSSVMMSQVSCPGGVIVLLVSVSWFLMWPRFFLIFSLGSSSHITPTEVQYSWAPDFCLLGSTMDPWSHAASPGLAHSSDYPLSYTLNLPSDSPALAASQLYTLRLRDSVKGKKHNYGGWRDTSRKIQFANISFTKQFPSLG